MVYVAMNGFNETKRQEVLRSWMIPDSIKYFKTRQVNIKITVWNILPSRCLFSTHHVGNNMRTEWHKATIISHRLLDIDVCSFSPPVRSTCYNP